MAKRRVNRIVVVVMGGDADDAQRIKSLKRGETAIERQVELKILDEEIQREREEDLDLFEHMLEELR